MDNNLDIVGVYRFYIGNKLVSEQKNAFTEAGRSIAIKSLLGIIPDFANTIAYGVDSSSNVFNSASTLITNNVLGFEVGRTPVIASTLENSGTNDLLIYSGTISDAYQYSIYEVGLFPANEANQSSTLDVEILLNFDLLDTFTKYGTYTSASLATASIGRIGSTMLIIPEGNASANYLEKVYDSNSLYQTKLMSSQDLFKLSLFNESTTSGASVNFRFYTDDTNYYTVPFVSPAASGYHIVSVQKGNAVLTGNPDWSNINKIRIWSTSSYTMYLDGLKIDKGSYFSDTTFGMISRAVLNTPVFKPASVPVNIQYSLLVNFTGGS
jgi:hypothetical protein